MARAQGLLTDRERALVEPLRLAILALGLIHECQIVEGGGVIRVTGSKSPLDHRFKLLRFDHRRSIIASLIVFLESFVDRLGVALLRPCRHQRQICRQEKCEYQRCSSVWTRDPHDKVLNRLGLKIVRPDHVSPSRAVAPPDHSLPTYPEIRIRPVSRSRSAKTNGLSTTIFT